MYTIIRPCITLTYILFFLAGCGSKQDTPAAKDSAQAHSKEVSLPPAEKPADVTPIGQATQLQYQFTSGDAFGYRIRTVTNVTETTDSVKQESVQDITYAYTFAVLNTNDKGEASLRVTCTELLYKGKFGTREMKYDSKAPADKSQERLFAQYTAVLKRPFELTVDRFGTVVGIGKVDKIIQALAGDDYRTMKMETKQKISDDYANGQLKNQLQIAFQKLSEKPVSTNDHWSINWEGRIGFLDVKNTGIYTLEGSPGGAPGSLARIGIAMKTEYIGPKKMDTGQGMATIEALDAKGTGFSIFDLARHRIRSRSMDQRVMTRLVVDPPEDLKQQMPNIGLIHIAQDATIKTTVDPL